MQLSMDNLLACDFCVCVCMCAYMCECMQSCLYFVSFKYLDCALKTMLLASTPLSHTFSGQEIFA